MNDGDRDASTSTNGLPEERLRVGERADGSAVWLPTVNVLTGRAFVSGKSGSGKSNTASVVIEELLDRAFPVLVVDTDGEYFGLKEEYELLHAGADDECDVRVGPEHAEKLASLALERNVPIVLDVSGYLDGDAADELVRETARHLFAKEKKLKKPFLLVVEEIHEYVPEGAGMDETGRMLVKVGKRGRKHGLGILGISQRPADVKKDFITQANWLVWHRLTWDNDTEVVRRIVGSEYGNRVADLDDGEAFVQLDWTGTDVERVRFRRKRTFDAGATPGLEDVERPELKSVSDDLTGDLATISERERREADRVAELESELERRERRIEELERELDRARDVSTAAERIAEAVAGGTVRTGPTDGNGNGNADADTGTDGDAGTHEDGNADGNGADGPDVRGLLERVRSLEASLGVGGAVPGDDRRDGDSGPVRAGTTDGDSRPDTGTPAGTDDPPSNAGDGGRDTRAGDDTGDGRAYPGLTQRTAPDRPNDPDPPATDGERRDDGAPLSDVFEDYRSIERAVASVRDRDGASGGTDDGAGPDDTAGGVRTGGRSSDREASVGTPTVPDGERTEADRRDRPDGSGRSRGPNRGSTVDGAGSDRRRGPTTGPETGSDTRTREPSVPELLRSDPVAAALKGAVDGADCNREAATAVVGTLAERGPQRPSQVARTVGCSVEAATSLLVALRERSLVERNADHRYTFDRAGMLDLVDREDDRATLGELRSQWDV